MQTDDAVLLPDEHELHAHDDGLKSMIKWIVVLVAAGLLSLSLSSEFGGPIKSATHSIWTGLTQGSAKSSLAMSDASAKHLRDLLLVKAEPFTQEAAQDNGTLQSLINNRYMSAEDHCTTRLRLATQTFVGNARDHAGLTAASQTLETAISFCGKYPKSLEQLYFVQCRTYVERARNESDLRVRRVYEDRAFESCDLSLKHGDEKIFSPMIAIVKVDIVLSRATVTPSELRNLLKGLKDAMANPAADKEGALMGQLGKRERIVQRKLVNMRTREVQPTKRLRNDANKPRASAANEARQIKGRATGKVHVARSSRAVAKRVFRYAKRQVVPRSGFRIAFCGVAFNGNYSRYNADRCRIMAPAPSPG